MSEFEVIIYDGSYGDLVRVAESLGYEEPDPVDPRYDDGDCIEEDMHLYLSMKGKIALTQSEKDSGEYGEYTA